MRHTRNELNALLAEIASKTNQATSEEKAKEIGKEKYLYLEYAPLYGGYRVVNVRVTNGSHSGAFGGNGCEARLSAREMYIKLTNILEGINAVAAN